MVLCDFYPIPLSSDFGGCKIDISDPSGLIALPHYSAWRWLVFIMGYAPSCPTYWG